MLVAIFTCGLLVFCGIALSISWFFDKKREPLDSFMTFIFDVSWYVVFLICTILVIRFIL